MNESEYTKEVMEDGRIVFTPIEKEDDWSGGHWYVATYGGDEFSSYEPSTLELESGNVFHTREQAELASKYMAVSNNIIRACLEVEPDFAPDWISGDSEKWFVEWCGDDGWTINSRHFYAYGVPSVSTPDNAKRVCELLTKRGIKPVGA